MNLFEYETVEALESEGFTQDWIRELSSTLDHTKFTEVLKRVNKDRNIKTIYPDKEDVFKIFKLLRYQDVKVVIIGQDPYYNGNANGVAFACKNMSSPSLQKIGEAIIDNGYKYNAIRKKDLLYLVSQGVFLYNPILTVVKGLPLSHKEIGWQIFTSSVFKALNRKKDLIWLLWGNSAKDYARFIEPTHKILTAEHPSSAARNGKKWSVNHFKETNDWLKSKGLTEIWW